MVDRDENSEGSSSDARDGLDDSPAPSSSDSEPPVESGPTRPDPDAPHVDAEPTRPEPHAPPTGEADSEGSKSGADFETEKIDSSEVMGEEVGAQTKKVDSSELAADDLESKTRRVDSTEWPSENLDSKTRKVDSAELEPGDAGVPQGPTRGVDFAATPRSNAEQSGVSRTEDEPESSPSISAEQPPQSDAKAGGDAASREAPDEESEEDRFRSGRWQDVLREGLGTFTISVDTEGLEDDSDADGVSERVVLAAIGIALLLGFAIVGALAALLVLVLVR